MYTSGGLLTRLVKGVTEKLNTQADMDDVQVGIYIFCFAVVLLPWYWGQMVRKKIEEEEKRENGMKAMKS